MHQSEISKTEATRYSGTAKGRELNILVVGLPKIGHVTKRAQGLRSLGHRVTLLSFVPEQPVDGLQVLAPREWRLPLPGRVKSALGLFKLYRTIRATKADLLYIHYASTAHAWFAFATGYHPLAVNVMGLDVLLDCGWVPSRLARWLTKKLLCSADLVTSKSEKLTADLVRLGVPSSRILDTVWGVDPEEFQRKDTSDLRKKWHLAQDDLVILSPRIMLPMYNIHVIADALPLVVARYPTARFLFCEYHANSKYLEQIKAIIRKHKLEENVRFVGHIQHDQMPGYYSLADLVVMVPVSDALPQSLFEAMACETPTILGNLKRYQQIVTHGEDAWLVDIDSKSLGNAIVTLLNSPELRRRIGTKARQTVQQKADFRTELVKVDSALQEIARRAFPGSFNILQRIAFLALAFLACLFPGRWSLENPVDKTCS